jgi:hypothetical protein
MKRIACSVGLVAALGWGGPARASDRIGALAVIDEVVFEQSDGGPTRVRLRGTFALLKAADRVDYGAPARGYFYYAAVPGKEAACRREWADLKKAADRGQVIGFGRSSALAGMGRLRKPGEKVEFPDPYPLNFGLVAINPNAGWTPVKELATLPAPLTPEDDAEVSPGKVTLVARNILDKGHAQASYVFELENSSGQKEVSPAVPAGKAQTKWSPRLEVKAGERYIWRVRAVDGAWKGPAASSGFDGKARP